MLVLTEIDVFIGAAIQDSDRDVIILLSWWVSLLCDMLLMQNSAKKILGIESGIVSCKMRRSWNFFSFYKLGKNGGRI